MSLLDYNKNELSGEDLLERDCQLYKFVKKNYCDILEIIDMITGEIYNVYEGSSDNQTEQENNNNNETKKLIVEKENSLEEKIRRFYDDNNRYLLFEDRMKLSRLGNFLKDYEFYKFVEENLHDIQYVINVLLGLSINCFENYDEFKKNYKYVVNDEEEIYCSNSNDNKFDTMFF